MTRLGDSRKATLALAAVLGWGGTLLVLPQAVGQEPAAPAADQLFGEEIDVRVVNLEVVVEDGDGNRIQGLSADDFRVLVDGEEVDIEYFTDVARGRARPTDGAEAPPGVGESGVVATNYLLLVDGDHSVPAFRRPVLLGFAARLGELQAQDRVAVVVQNRRRLQLLSPFTTDREATRAALEEMDPATGFGRGRTPGLSGGWYKSRGLDRFLSDIEPLWAETDRWDHPSVLDAGVTMDQILAEGVIRRGAYDGGPNLGGHGAVGRSMASNFVFERMSLQRTEQEAEAAILERELELSVDAVVSAMRALDPPEGRKVLLLLAGDWPIGDFRLSGLRTDLQLLDELIDTANLLGYTVYPLDQQSGRPSMRLWQNLRYLARETGGRAFMAGSNVTAMEVVSVDTSNYYWLGFVPEYRRDDKPHDVEVEVLRPGVQVRARRSYLDLSRSAEADMESQRALLFPGEAKPGAGALQVRIGATGKVLGRKMTVPIDIAVPVGRFAALPFGDQHVQSLELRFATIDRQGRRAEQPAIPLELRSDLAPAPDSIVPYHADVTMRRAPHTLVITVHDPVSRLTAVARVEVEP